MRITDASIQERIDDIKHAMLDIIFMAKRGEPLPDLRWNIIIQELQDLTHMVRTTRDRYREYK
jgi:hypothetical protein